MAGPNIVPNLYKSVVEDVVNNVREAFLDDGVDDHVLQELKQLWMNKLTSSKAVESKSEGEVMSLYSQNSALVQQAALQRQRQQQAAAAAAAQQRQQQQQQQQAQQQQILQSQLPTVVNAQNVAAAATEVKQSQVGQVSAAAAPLQGALYGQQLAALQTSGLQGGQIITLQTAQGPAQFLVQAPQGQLLQQQATGGATVQLNASQLAAAQQQQQQQQQQVLAAAAAAQPQQQQQQQAQLGGQTVVQLDGTHETSSDDDDDNDQDDDDDDDNDKDDEDADADQGEEEEPLNSNDDVSDEDPAELFDTDNVVVCQFDKINRTKNKWKFHLKDGIMNLNGKDYVFQRATGDAHW